MLIILLIGAFLLARDCAGYDSAINKGKYILINNISFQKFLLPKKRMVTNFSKRVKEDKNKMTIAGLIFYSCLSIIILLIPILLIFVPKIPINPYEIDTRYIYIYVDTLNQKIPVLLTILLITFEFTYYLFTLFKINKFEIKKGIKIGIYFLCSLLFVLMFLSIIFTFKEIICCFI